MGLKLNPPNHFLVTSVKQERSTLKPEMTCAGFHSAFKEKLTQAVLLKTTRC